MKKELEKYLDNKVYGSDEFPEREIESSDRSKLVVGYIDNEIASCHYNYKLKKWHYYDAFVSMPEGDFKWMYCPYEFLLDK